MYRNQVTVLRRCTNSPPHSLEQALAEVIVISIDEGYQSDATADYQAILDGNKALRLKGVCCSEGRQSAAAAHHSEAIGSNGDSWTTNGEAWVVDSRW
jgi:hypothetical protein